MENKYTHEELAGQLKSPGWRLTSAQSDKTVTGTLGEVLAESHSRKSNGEHPGRIEQIKTAIELDIFQIDLLWRQLGLPEI
jgi:hypothetical protein